MSDTGLNNLRLSSSDFKRAQRSTEIMSFVCTTTEMNENDFGKLRSRKPHLSPTETGSLIQARSKNISSSWIR